MFTGNHHDLFIWLLSIVYDMVHLIRYRYRRWNIQIFDMHELILWLLWICLFTLFTYHRFGLVFFLNKNNNVYVSRNGDYTTTNNVDYTKYLHSTKCKFLEHFHNSSNNDILKKESKFMAPETWDLNCHFLETIELIKLQTICHRYSNH